MIIKPEYKGAIESVSNTIAVGAVAAPAWYPWMMDVSSLAALVLPILGAIWLIIQIVAFFTTGKKNRD